VFLLTNHPTASEGTKTANENTSDALAIAKTSAEASNKSAEASSKTADAIWEFMGQRSSVPTIGIGTGTTPVATRVATGTPARFPASSSSRVAWATDVVADQGTFHCVSSVLLVASHLFLTSVPSALLSQGILELNP